MNQNTNKTTQPTKTYSWERLPHISFNQARAIFRRFKPIKKELLDALDEIKMLGKKLNGERLRIIFDLVGGVEKLRPKKPAPPPRPRFLTQDPGTRRCLRCGTVKPLNSFVARVTVRQAERWGYTKRKTGMDALTPRQLKLHKRKTIRFLCADCIGTPAKRHSAQKSYQQVLRQINYEKRRLIRKKDRNTNPELMALKTRLLHAAALAKDRKNRGIRCPETWQELLKK